MDADQRLCLDMALNGHSFLILGQAGTGKSFILRQIGKELEHRGKKPTIAASTGMTASQSSDGYTLHKLCGPPSNRL